MISRRSRQAKSTIYGPWLLADEFAAVNGARPKPVPELQLGLRGLPAKPACPFGLLFICAAHAEAPPHPTCVATLTLRSQVDLSPHAGRNGARGSSSVK